MDSIIDICLSGKFEKNVDSKRRVNLPALLTHDIHDKIFHITRGPDHNLFVYPRQVFSEKAKRLNKSFGERGQKDKSKRLYFLETMADAHPVQCDQQGRIIIPQELLDYAQISDKILIIGAFEKMIFWNPELFKKMKQEVQSTEQERVSEYGWAEEE